MSWHGEEMEEPDGELDAALSSLDAARKRIRVLEAEVARLTEIIRPDDDTIAALLGDDAA